MVSKQAACLLVVAFAVRAQTTDDPKTILERSIRAEDRSDLLAVNYTYRSRNVVKELDGKGSVKSTKDTTEETVYLGGKRFMHLLEKDGKPLTGSEARKEQDRFDRATAEAAKLSTEQKEQRRQRELEERRKNLEQRRHIPLAYELKLLREEIFNGRPAWVIHATPRRDYSGKYAGLLKNLEGDIWIDKGDYHWAKVTAHALDNFSLGLFLARIGKDTEIQFELARINNEVWLPKFVSVRAAARLALLKKLNLEQQIVFSDYKRYSSDSRIVPTPEP